jgi:predicted TPR repeat methyltransferase
MLAAVAAALEPSGMLACTLQKSDAAPVALGADHRYAHTPEHVRDAAEAAGLTVPHLEEASYRTEAGRPVPGLIVVCARV